MFWPLMKNCITEADREAMSQFVLTTERFTNGPKVREFEKLWSEWLGVKYSLFVSSGSTANFLLVAAVIEKYNLKRGDKVLLPAMTWVTNVSPPIQLGLEPVFCDVDPTTFCFDIEHMKQIKKEHPDIKLVFVSHLFGLAGDMDAYKEVFPEAVFIEDVCESHGAVIGDKKCGTLSDGGTFSFYFGHHMTTIEGGFVSTDDDELYEIMRTKRSHGLAREASKEKFEEYKEKYPNIHPQFLFVTDGYNFRSTELNAVLGISQLKSLSKNNEIRRKNLERFLEILERYNYYDTDIKTEGNSSYCMIFKLKTKQLKESLERTLNLNGVETRPLCSGNLLEQPFLAQYKDSFSKEGNLHINELHDKGFFIGNNHLITDEDFERFAVILEEFDRGLS